MQAMDAVPHEHQGAKIGRCLAVAPQDVAANRLDFVPAERDVHLHDVGRVEQPPDMLLQAENGGPAVLAMVSPDALEDPRP